MNKLTIPTAILAAVAPFMAKKDVRYYLNGARIESEHGYIRAIATDGHALAVCDAPGTEAVLACILPREAVEWAVKAGGDVVLEWDGFVGALTTAAGVSMPVKLIDGRFPDYQAVIPILGDKPEHVGGFNPELLSLIAKATAGLKKAGKTSRHPGVTLFGNGPERSIGFLMNGLLDRVRLLGCIMPMRDTMAARSDFSISRAGGAA